MNLRHDNKVEIVHESEVQEKKNCNVTVNRLGLEKLNIGDHSEEKVIYLLLTHIMIKMSLKCLESKVEICPRPTFGLVCLLTDD